MAQTPSVTDYGQIQENEIQVLQSIYMDDFKEEKAKQGPWNKRADPSFQISLRAPSEPSDDIKVVLSVKYPRTYPKTLPQISLAYSDGVSAKARRIIDSVVKSRSKELLGQESIFEIATSIQDSLDDAATNLAQAQELPTLDEERVIKEAEAEQRARDMQAEEEQRQKDAQDEETRNLTEMVERERARLSKLSTRTAATFGGASDEQGGPGIIAFDRDVRHKTQDGTVIVLRSVRRKGVYRTGPVTRVSTACAFDAGEDCVPCFALKECTISTKGSPDALKKRVQGLEVSFDNLLRLPSHPTLLKPHGFRIEKIPAAESGAVGGWNVHVLSGFMPKGSLRDLLENTGTLNPDMARTWIVQILEGLDYLHRSRIAHGRLNPSNVLLERSADGETTVKLADFVFQQELHAIQETSARFSSAPSAYWLCPDNPNDNNLGASSPRDIWDLGVLLLQLFFGLEVQRKYNSPGSLIEESSLSLSFERFVSRTFTANPRKRPSAFELLPEEFLRNNDPVLDDSLSSSMVSRRASLQSPSKSARTRRESANFKMGNSRYATDFVELSRLGKGGFGEVVKARNKLDGSVYAIKKITQTSASALSSVLSEVMLLSRLNSPFIVRYYIAWIEEEGQARSSKQSDSSEDETTSDVLSLMPHSTTGGLDFLSSGGYPGIEFGYDSDDDDAHSQALHDEESGDEDADESGSKLSERDGAPAAKQHARRHSSVNMRGPVTLYIAMEYCEKQTLRDLIKGDISKNVEEVWRLLQQILQGLVHIHQNGLIHRDIKPENIFIDQSNTARIGDFGLATPGQMSAKSSTKGFVAPELTASIGTSVYVAPEVRSKGGGSYNEKADMYSLGVVLFEMCYPMGSAMERARTLDALRTEPCQFPSVFDEPEKKLQKDIIASLVRHQVGQRPSSQELLRSGKIPSQVEDEAVQAALKSLSDKSSPFFAKLLSSLFSPATDEKQAVKDLTYDLNVNVKTQVKDLLIQGYVKDQLIETFRRHGALETQRLQILPASTLSGTETARFLDPSGNLIQLLHDLRLPFARVVARRPDLVTCRKSFSFGQVFRRNPSGGHPFMHSSVDFDIVSNDSLDMALREAEMIKVLDESLDHVPSLRSANIYFQLSHSKLLGRILESVAAEERHGEPIKQAVSKLYTGTPQWTWAKVKNELRSVGVSSTTIDDLMQFDFRLSGPEAIAKLRGLLGEIADLEGTFRHLLAIETYLQRFKINRPIFVYPLASLNEHYYRGNMLFQAILDSPKKKTVLCAGGRYDALVQEQRPGSKGSGIHALGFSLAWDILIESTIRWYQHSPGKKFLKKGEDNSDAPTKIRRCDVLIDSGDPAILRSSGIQLAQELWENEISAELVIDAGVREGTSHYHQANQDESVSHDWLLLIKKDESVKVRSLVSQEDTEVRRSELLGWLKGEMRERDRLEPRANKTRHPHHGSHQDQTGGHEPEVAVLVAQSRSKKSNRRNIVDDAQARTQEAAEAFKDCPIKAVEMKDEVFEGLRETRLGDGDSWRRFIQGAPLSERTYLEQLHQMLLDAGKGGERHVWLYNFRSRACLLYRL